MAGQGCAEPHAGGPTGGYDTAMNPTPCTWGPGQLFAFSGMEGPTAAASPMVAHTLGDRLGLRIFFEPPIELWCQGFRGDDPQRRYPRCMPDFEVVAGDAIRMTLRFTDGRGCPLAYAPLDQDTFAGLTSPRLPPHCSALRPGGPLPAGTHVLPIAQGAAVLAVRETADGLIRFALGHDAASEATARARAEQGTRADLDGVIDRRAAWYAGIALPPRLPPELAPTYGKAVSNMRVNTCSPEGQIRHAWTTPDRWPHRWMWLHDSAYHSAGHVHHFPEIAKEMLLAVFDTQENEGRIALLMRPDGNWPDLSQSPVLAWAVRNAWEATQDLAFAAEIYPKLRAYLDYFHRTRRFHDTGLYRWAHSDESMDNNPRFDGGCDFGAVDLSAALCREFEDAAALAEALGRTDDAARWHHERQAVGTAINERLWDPAAGQYGDLLPDGRINVLSTCVTFLPLFAGIVPPDRVARLRTLLTDARKFWRAVPVPSVAADEPSFYPDMWRGPAWVNMNHLIALGLDRNGLTAEAAELRRRTIGAIHRWCRHTGCIYEFYDTDDRIPPFAIDRKSRLAYGGGFTNVSDYHWTSALFVAMCRRLYD